MSLDFNFSLEELEAAEAATANPYLSNPAKGLELVARLVGQPSADLVQDEQRALLAQLHQLIHTDFIALTSKGSYPGEAQALRELLALEQSLENLALFPDLAQRTIVGVGGGFSAGKSRFLNTLLGVDLLPESLEPTTAIPSFIAHGSHDGIVALNSFNHKASLDRDALQAITHAFNQHYRETLGESFGFAHILKLLMLHSPALAWQNLAFLDTPGYSKADTQANAQNDAAIAQRQLSEADHVLWLLNAKNGSIREDDLNFLRTLNPSQPVFFVVTQADLVGESRIQAILSSTQEAINNAGIPCAGLMAWAAPLNTTHGINMGGQDVRAWLDTLNNKQKTTQYGRQCEKIIDGYLYHYRRLSNKNRDYVSSLNHVIANSADMPLHENATIKEMLKEQRNNQALFQEQSNKFTEFKSALLSTVNNIATSFAIETLSSDQLYSNGLKLKAENALEAAFDCMEEAAQLEHREAQYELSQFYLDGSGTMVDKEKSIFWLKKSAEKNYDAAQFSLGNAYLCGINDCEKNKLLGISWITKAAESEHIEAQYKLGRYFLLDENNEDHDTALGIEWLTKAAESEHVEAQYELGKYLLLDEENEDHDTALGIKWLTKAAESKHVEAQYELGKYLLHDKNHDTALGIKWLTKAAKSKYAEAQYELGKYLLRDENHDPALGIKWLTKAAESKHVEAQYELGKYLLRDENHDPALGIKWLTKASDLGHIDSSMYLAESYYLGHTPRSIFGRSVSRNIPTDKSRAIDLLKKAQDKGSSSAERVLVKIRNNESDPFKTSCFITTAACSYQGLPDNCVELTTMRQFRDNYLIKTAEGAELVATYYAISPTLVEKMNYERDIPAIWKSIKTCIHFIEHNEPDSAIETYKEMVKCLQTKVQADHSA